MLKKITIKVLNLLFKFSITIKLDILTVLILVLLTKKLNKVVKHGKYKVLCLSKSVFNDDVSSLACKSTTIEYLLFPRLHLLEIYRQYFEYNDEVYFNYHLDGGYNQQKELLRSRYTHILRNLKKLLKFDAILSGNFVYLSQQEFAYAARNLGIPFIVLYKEGMAPKESFEPLIKTYHNKIFIGDRIMFYNKNIRDAFVSAVVPGMSESITRVVGIPRLDLLKSIKPDCDAKTITLFSFYQKDKVSSLFKDFVDVQLLEQRSDEFHLHVIEFAKRNPEYQVVIKTKAGPTYMDYIHDLSLRYGVNLNIANLVITNNLNAQSLIKRSVLVLGYMSTTLLESLYLGVRIASPNFSDVSGDKILDYFSNNKELVSYINCYDDLDRAVRDAVKNQGCPANTSKFLEDYCYKIDGRSCERVEKEIIEVIKDVC